jgi:hypothetical protein
MEGRLKLRFFIVFLVYFKNIRTKRIINNELDGTVILTSGERIKSL